MDESSSGFGDESPILFKCPKLFENDDSNHLNLEELYKDLLQYLKKTKEIAREDLKYYLEQVTKMDPYGHKHRWLVQKIKGLLKFILKKRSAFQDCVVKGEIIIYEKSALGEKSSMPNTPVYTSNSTFEIPSRMLSNNNFELMDTSYGQKPNYNYSQDLFSSATESLHNFGQENYQLFKELTNHSQNDDNLFKLPEPIDTKIEKVYKMHQTLNEEYNSLVSLTPSVSQIVGAAMAESLKLEDNVEEELVPEYKINATSNAVERLDITIFDNEEISEDLLKEDFRKESEKMEKYIQDIVSNLLRLEVKELRNSPKILDSKNAILNESNDSGSTCLKTYHSEENFKIIRETCAKFRKNLEKKKDLDFLQEFLNLS